MSIKSIVFRLRSMFRPTIDSVDAAFSKTLLKLDKVVEDQEFIAKEAAAQIEAATYVIAVSNKKVSRANAFRVNLASLMGLDTDEDGVPDVEQV